ncbi:alcohol dehydrogenase [NADP(+)] B-like [Trichogramma pretiosum]|uniref:alcohol dehydrogenase [NADP(+)] B-like n=1 Tax=Trichogramma pretiosum TaxID=7493 RepID=UPI0006C9CBD4|nr:alcohol dehydrogenase [NADP(+)] B-like [Trichogramma pretiosum]XP_023315031.1 alcohol dehydrogenase [NADP(+)] B-like [Trichogramma pretiosum]
MRSSVILCFCLILMVINLPDAQCNFVMPRFQLSSGYEMPVIGLGTSDIKDDEVEQAVLDALDSGHRYIDAGYIYHKEKAIGRALKKWFDKGGKRNELFILSKLPPFANSPAGVEKYLRLTLRDLGLRYIDMYLIHTPKGIKGGDSYTIKASDKGEIFQNVDLNELWRAMEEQVKKGRTRSIGLSNFNKEEISKIYDSAEIKPSNLQVESNAYLHQFELRKFCKEHDIVMTGYFSLGSSKVRHGIYAGTDKDLPSLLSHPVVKKIADSHGKNTGQVLYKHAVQDGVVVLQTSTKPHRIRSNLDIFDFELTEDEMKQLDALDEGERGRILPIDTYYDVLPLFILEKEHQSK